MRSLVRGDAKSAPSRAEKARPGAAEGAGGGVCGMEWGMRSAGRTFARILPDKWGDPRISSVLEHDEKVRHENSNCISKLSNPPFDRQEEVVRPGRGFCSRFAPAAFCVIPFKDVAQHPRRKLS